jgi:hypothetical protein
MTTTIKLKNGEVFYMMYRYDSNHDCEIYPFWTNMYDKQNFLDDGNYLLDDDRTMVIKDKKIIEMI